MWVLTRSDWPILINLDRAAVLGYQQLAKFDPRMRLVAVAWEQEHVLAECADGDQARGLMIHIASAIASGDTLLDLRDVDLVRIAQEFAADHDV